MERVVMTRPFIGLLYMQVCAVKDATDEEILETANEKNMCGTSQGWCTVHREDDEEGRGPVQCEQEVDRLHFLVSC